MRLWALPCPAVTLEETDRDNLFSLHMLCSRSPMGRNKERRNRFSSTRIRRRDHLGPDPGSADEAWATSLRKPVATIYCQRYSTSQVRKLE